MLNIEIDEHSGFCFGVTTAIKKAGSDGVVLCFGSLYSIADIHAGLMKLK